MEYIIGKVCNRLVSNPHVIGILLNCSDVEADDLFVEDPVYPESRQIELCIISKEAISAKNVYMEEGFRITLKWASEEYFINMIEKGEVDLTYKKVLYDKTGLIHKKFSHPLATA